jgi:hypothetical protein
LLRCRPLGQAISDLLMHTCNSAAHQRCASTVGLHYRR